MLTNEQISAYFENGYLLVEDVVTPEQLQRMQDITHEFIDRSRHVTASNDVYDLDQGHNSETPKLTRIKLPHKQHPFFWDVLKNSGITEVLRQLVGPNAVLQTSKLNAKAPGGGAGGPSIRRRLAKMPYVTAGVAHSPIIEDLNRGALALREWRGVIVATTVQPAAF